MKLKDGIIVEKVGNEYIAVAAAELSRDFHGIIRGNSTMNFLLSCMKEEVTETDIINAMLEKYDVTEEIAKRDVKELIEKLTNAGLIE